MNRDGRVDLKDAVLALEGSIGLTPLTPQQAAADIDGSGTVDIKDATAILRKAIGL